MSLPDHLESHLGRIERGWTEPEDAVTAGIMIAQFEARDGVRAYATLGLSRKPLRPNGSRTHVHQELVLLMPLDGDEQRGAALLGFLCEEAIEAGRAFARGEVAGPLEAIVEGTDLVHLYVTSSDRLSRGLGTHVENGVAIELAWIVPITFAEAERVLADGWRSFEDACDARGGLGDAHGRGALPWRGMIDA